MHQLSGNVKKPSSGNQKLDQLEAEYQQNQERISKLQRRNHDLAEKIHSCQISMEINTTQPRSLGRTRKPKSVARLVVDRFKTLSRTRIGKYSLGFWIRAALLLVVVALICGFLGFLLTRLVGILIGA
jgi:hypothetical protein